MKKIKNDKNWLKMFLYGSKYYRIFFFFSFAYTTSPAAVMKLVVVFNRSAKPPYNFW